MIELLFTIGSLFCSLLFMVVSVVGVVWFVSKMSAGGFTMPTGGGPIRVDELQKMYTDTLGYRAEPTANPTGPTATTHQIREFEGRNIHYRSSTRPAGTGIEVALTWSLTRETPVGRGIHIVERGVASGLQRTVQDMAMNRTRKFEPLFSTAVEVGDPELDKRFTFYAEDPAAAARIRELKAELLALPYVEVFAKGSEIVFNDPFQQALLAVMGGPMGMMAITSPEGIAKQVKLHNGVAALLVGIDARV